MAWWYKQVQKGTRGTLVSAFSHGTTVELRRYDSAMSAWHGGTSKQKAQAQGETLVSGLCIRSWHYWSWYYWSCGAPQNALITGVPVVTSHAAKKARASIATRPLSISAS